MKMTAYLLDTDEWSGFADNSYAEYAIAAPTLELFAASGVELVKFENL
jgi:hypothetical protein